MVTINPALIIANDFIKVPATRDEAAIINAAIESVSDQIVEYAAKRGLNIYDFAVPDYERVVTRTPLMPPSK
jgi:hypothetical protein